MNNEINKIPGLDQVSVMINSMSHPARVAIMWLLSNEESMRMTVKNIYEKLQLPQPVVSRHLAILRSGGLLQRQTEGRLTYYAAIPENGIAIQIIACFRALKPVLNPGLQKKV